MHSNILKIKVQHLSVHLNICVKFNYKYFTNKITQLHKIQWDRLYYIQLSRYFCLFVQTKGWVGLIIYLFIYTFIHSFFSYFFNFIFIRG